jgi:hypothetical protein
MKKDHMLKSILLSSVLLSLSSNALAKTPQNFLYTSSDELSHIEALIKRHDIEGVQIVYNWKMLEKGINQYDFSQIEKDLKYLSPLNKKLFIQIQDRFFSKEHKNVPMYLLEDSIYNGGVVEQFDNPGEDKPIGSGWVAQQWNPAVQKRYQELLKALAKKFDGLIFGINLPETSIDLQTKKDTSGFTCDTYFNAELENLAFAKNVFKKSHVVQYINFWPCEWDNDHKFMSRIFAFAEQHRVGLGGPDIVPNKKAQMKNSYPFFHKYKGKLSLVAMAVQEPTLTYTNPKTKRPFTKEEFTEYAENYLGADMIFWSLSSPWLQQK